MDLIVDRTLQLVDLALQRRDDRDDEESGGGEGQAVGAAYAFSSNDEAKLKIRGVLAPSDGAADDSFGMSVAMDKRDNSGTVDDFEFTKVRRELGREVS